MKEDKLTVWMKRNYGKKIFSSLTDLEKKSPQTIYRQRKKKIVEFSIETFHLGHAHRWSSAGPQPQRVLSQDFVTAKGRCLPDKHSQEMKET